MNTTHSISTPRKRDKYEENYQNFMAFMCILGGSFVLFLLTLAIVIPLQGPYITTKFDVPVIREDP